MFNSKLYKSSLYRVKACGNKDSMFFRCVCTICVTLLRRNYNIQFFLTTQDHRYVKYRWSREAEVYRPQNKGATVMLCLVFEPTDNNGLELLTLFRSYTKLLLIM